MNEHDHATGNPMTNPPLKWAGGKRWLLPTLQGLLPPHTRLVEPFMGALSVTLGLDPKTALVNDANPHLVNFYRQVQRGLIMDIPYSHDEQDYYNARDEFNKNITSGDIWSPRMAMLFYYLNRTGFNGLCRFNRSGLFNVPFGRYKTIHYRQDFNDITKYLQSTDISCDDFAQLNYKDGDFIYADPPYDTPFTSYSSGGFDWNEQVRTAQFFACLSLPVVLSNQSTPRIIELYGDLGFELRFLDAPRRISSNGDRSHTQEVLAIKSI